MSPPALTRRVALTLLSILAGITAALAGGGRPTDTGDEPPTQQQGQDFVCDLNDGRIDLEVLRDGTVRYERDVMYGAFNVYRGEVDVMVSAGIYTQELVAVSGAKHWCDTTTGILMDQYTPPLGHISFYVATGTRTDGESFPGKDSVQKNRPHHHPCHPCHTNANCGAGTFCSKAPENCSGKGVCTRTPTVCPDVWLPVCGCDGATYGNTCEASAAGVSVQHAGECATECTENFQCAAGEYCAKTTGDCGGVGHCEVRPQACITLWEPVCGCGIVTYGNACEAAAASRNILHLGECGTECTVDTECEAGEWCKKAPGMCGGGGDCIPLPVGVDCEANVDPVCGCDARSYTNACEAYLEAVNVAYDGICACTTNADCPSTQFCLKQDLDCNGAGTCAVRPTVCPDVENDICGCDGRIHMNSCVAHRNGTNVAPFSVCFP